MSEMHISQKRNEAKAPAGPPPGCRDAGTKSSPAFLASGARRTRHQGLRSLPPGDPRAPAASKTLIAEGVVRRDGSDRRLQRGDTFRAVRITFRAARGLSQIHERLGAEVLPPTLHPSPVECPARARQVPGGAAPRGPQAAHGALPVNSAAHSRRRRARRRETVAALSPAAVTVPRRGISSSRPPR